MDLYAFGERRRGGEEVKEQSEGRSFSFKRACIYLNLKFIPNQDPFALQFKKPPESHQRETENGERECVSVVFRCIERERKQRIERIREIV